MTQITEELCGTSFSKSTVSALCARLDPLVGAWNERPLAEQALPFVLVDALVLKVREDERVRSLAGLVAIGVNASGYREILGLQLGDSESDASWSAFFGWLKRRGLSGVDVVVSDAHGGLVNAVRRHFQNASWQRCQTHLTRDILEATPKSLRSELHDHLRTLFEAADPATARTLLQQLVTTYTARAPKALAALEAGFDDATAVLAVPDPYRRRLRTTNSLERPERGDPPARARHSHLPQSCLGAPLAGGGPARTARAVDDRPPLSRHDRVLAVAGRPRCGARTQQGRGGLHADSVRGSG